MKILFFLGHPAHFHLFKNTIADLKSRGHTVYILNKKKDVLDALLIKSGFDFQNVMPKGRKDSRLGIAAGLIVRDIKLFRFCLNHRPDLMSGTSTEISHVGKILGIPSVCVNEDDHDVVPLFSKLGYPWATNILAPDSCRNGKWENKTIHYPGYHELAYLHPDHFSPDKKLVANYCNPNETYTIIRFAKLTAHHDRGIRGINTEIASRLISTLNVYGKVYITSERELEPQFEPYRINVKPEHIHDVMAFASLYIGDSQTMAAEAGVLGVPFIRFNDFVGRIGYLNELEFKYKLGLGFTPDQVDEMLAKVNELTSLKNIKTEWDEKRMKMLEDKINVAKFMTWFYENYPASVKSKYETVKI
jgi:predicted glycosyltransferase